MALSKQERQQLEAYNTGALAAPAAETLRRRLAEDGEFRAEVEAWETLWIIGTQPTSEERAARGRRKALLEELEKTLPPVAATPPTRRQWWWVAAAVVIGLGGVAWYLMKNEEVDFPSEAMGADSPMIQAFDPTYFDHFAREGANLSGGTIEQAYTAYDAKDYTTAWPLLREQVAATQDSILLLYAGVAALGGGAPDRAVEFLEAVRTSPDAVYFRGEIEWYLALAYLENGERARGEALLREIVKRGGFQRENAARLLEEF